MNPLFHSLKYFLAFNTSLKEDADDSDLGRTIQYHYERINQVISSDWTATRPPVSSLDRDFLRLSEETIEDGQLISSVIKIEGNGPILENCLENIPLRYVGKMDVDQLLQSRLLRCKLFQQAKK